MSNGVAEPQQSAASEVPASGDSDNSSGTQDADRKRCRVDAEEGACSEQLEIIMEDVDQMASSYVRTRHKNVRCFPRCAAVHKNKSFCGRSVYILLTGKVAKKEDIIVVGEFRNVRSASTFALGKEVSPTTEFSENVTEGVLLKQDDKGLSFAINPVRKWKFEGKIRPMDHYVFTVSAIVQGKVVAVKDSPSFTITPIWKTEGKDEEDDEKAEVRDGDSSSESRRPPSASASAPLPIPPLPSMITIPPPSGLPTLYPPVAESYKGGQPFASAMYGSEGAPPMPSMLQSIIASYMPQQVQLPGPSAFPPQLLGNAGYLMNPAPGTTQFNSTSYLNANQHLPLMGLPLSKRQPFPQVASTPSLPMMYPMMQENDRQSQQLQLQLQNQPQLGTQLGQMPFIAPQVLPQHFPATFPIVTSSPNLQ